MDPYIVSARKYRPATFDMVVGQPSITNTLKNAIRNQQLAQAFLFCGPRGVGKTTCARILAKTINCKNLSPDIEPCNECDSCVSFNRSASFNVYELDAASNNSVEDIRSLVDQVRIPPQAGKYKVYIIDEVHMLSLAAFNAFLKTLEEPPAYAKFILATTEKHKIIPTILSRCQIFDFRRISVDDIARHLAFVAGKEGVKADPDALHVIALKADGSLRDALSIFDQLVSFAGQEISYQDVISNLNVLDYEYYFRMMQHILEGDLRAALLLVHEILGNGFDGQHFIIGMGEHLRNLMVAMDSRTAGLLEVTEGYRRRYAEQAGECTQDLLLRALELANQVDLHYKTSNHKQLHLELGVMKLCSLTAQSTETTEVKKKTLTPSAQVSAREDKPSAPPPSRTASQAANVSAVSPAETGKKQGKARIGLGLDSKVGRHGTISLRPSEEEKQEEDETANQEMEAPENHFTEEEALSAWRSFADRLRQDKPSLYTTLIAGRPQLMDGWQLQFEVDNKVQRLEIEDIRGDLLENLRRVLGNGMISLRVEVRSKKQIEDRPYTPQEKFRHMSEQNPQLQQLKDRLNLDIDY